MNYVAFYVLDLQIGQTFITIRNIQTNCKHDYRDWDRPG